ncbi:hypothetical protein DSUL_20195 [Desulfovibrionales bacterium]
MIGATVALYAGNVDNCAHSIAILDGGALLDGIDKDGKRLVGEFTDAVLCIFRYLRDLPCMWFILVFRLVATVARFSRDLVRSK